MSPEQARGRPVDRRADIWAFGCVLFEMLSGRMAFGGEDIVADALQGPAARTGLDGASRHDAVRGCGPREELPAKGSTRAAA